MGLLSDPPFGLGQTLGVSSASDGGSWVGAVKEFTDVDPETGVIRSNRRKVCIAVRNSSAAALLPKRVVSFSTTAGKLFSEVTGYSAVTNAEAVGVVDEHLPAGGVAVNDVFWVTVNGPTEVAAALSGTDIAAGDKLAAITAATSGATTSGRVTPSPVSASTAGANNNGIGVIGYAVSAGATTGSAVLALITTKLA
jgi:hypothetical protein